MRHALWRCAALLLALRSVAPMQSVPREYFVSFGFEDWDFEWDRFSVFFPRAVSITRIEGFVSASMLPLAPDAEHHPHYIRQLLLTCHNGTTGVRRGEHAPEPYVVKEGPGQRMKRYELSLQFTGVEINIKQHDRFPVHLPVHYRYQVGQFIIQPEPEGRGHFYCDTDLQTYTGDFVSTNMNKDGFSSNPNECLDVEVHFMIHYVDWPPLQAIQGSE